jgi:tRNA(Ile)-lysidine synthetase-like protein
VRDFITAHHMIAPGALVVVAVSGGPDSLCLLHVLTQLRDDLGVALHVAHLDHMIRGAESADEAVFVAELAHEWALPYTIEASDIPSLARTRRANLHAAARAARYSFLARVARATGAHAVAVAHHAGDQAETVLLHLLRGAGPEGLSGMQAVTPGQEWFKIENAAFQFSITSAHSPAPRHRPRINRTLLRRAWSQPTPRPQQLRSWRDTQSHSSRSAAWPDRV